MQISNSYCGYSCCGKYFKYFQQDYYYVCTDMLLTEDIKPKCCVFNEERKFF